MRQGDRENLVGPKANFIPVFDVDQTRQQELQRLAVMRDLDVAVDRVEEPERGIGGVVEALRLAFGKMVWYQAVADVLRKRPQNVARLGVAAGHQGQAFEADHR